ncbi:MAG: ornithine cyclodeaminase [Herminiimonas sp.]|nr:ornithine cyclodeaminase [Herminiimonas sp.]
MANNAQLLLLDKDQVEQLLDQDQVLQAVRDAFSLHSKGEGRVFPVVRESLSTGGIFGIKSGDVQAEGLLGFKAAGFWPSNRARNGEPHQATIMLIDPSTGRPVCLIDGNAITTARTGAAGGLGLLYLARSDCKSLCIFGTGVQARIQLTFALKLLPSLRQIRYVTYDGNRDIGFESAFAGLCDIFHSTDRDHAVSISEIVITATPGGGALFNAAAVQPGTHINCVGADTKGKRELPEGLLDRVKLFVDDTAQARQIGETQWSPNTRCTELGDLLTEKVTFQRDAQDITVFDMTGLALQDLTVARLLHQSALANGIGSCVAWSW